MNWIYDRTQDDVFHAAELNRKYVLGTITDEEKVEWLSDLKGALNASDMNRIEGNIAQLASDIAKEVAAFDASAVATKQWSVADLPRVSDFARIKDNVECVRGAWYVMPDTPDTPDTPYNYYQKTNDIERILHDLYITYMATVKSYDYCGEFYAGEEVAYI